MRSDLDITMAICCQLQSVLHSLDDLSNSVKYKREFKMRIENFYSFTSKWVEGVTGELNTEQSQNYIDIVNKLDAIAKTITLKEDEND